jgi:hypothetical protein
MDPVVHSTAGFAWLHPSKPFEIRNPFSALLRLCVMMIRSPRLRDPGGSA